jgi:hypothetical protein
MRIMQEILIQEDQPQVFCLLLATHQQDGVQNCNNVLQHPQQRQSTTALVNVQSTPYGT